MVATGQAVLLAVQQAVQLCSWLSYRWSCLRLWLLGVWPHHAHECSPCCPLVWQLAMPAVRARQRVHHVCLFYRCVTAASLCTQLLQGGILGTCAAHTCTTVTPFLACRWPNRVYVGGVA